MELFLCDPELSSDPVDATGRLGLWGLTGACCPPTTFDLHGSPGRPTFLLQAVQGVRPGNPPSHCLSETSESSRHPGPSEPLLSRVPRRLVLCVKQDLSVALIG